MEWHPARVSAAAISAPAGFAQGGRESNRPGRRPSGGARRREEADVKRNTRREKGHRSVLALMLLAIFAVLAISLVSVHLTNLFQARNQAHIGSARLEAESGLSFLLHHLSYVSVRRPTRPARP